MANYRHSDTCNDFFLPLDNSAVFIASTTRKTSPYIFRVSCEFDEPIHLPDLEAVLGSVSDRFPIVKMRLKPGIFWYYLDPSTQSPRILADSTDPCEPPRFGHWRTSLVRVLVYANRLSVEFHHILTDGTGALEYLRTLAASYLTRRGVACDDWEDVIRPESQIEKGEYDDAYAGLFRQDVPFPDRLGRAFQLPGRRYAGNEYRVTTGSFSLAELLASSRARKVTITELLASMYVAALQEIEELSLDGNYLPITIQIPVNLRKFHATKTLRNFFLFIPVTVDRRLGHYSFDEILHRVHFSLRLGLDMKELSRQIKRNVRGERYLYSRAVPLFIKNLFLRNIGKKDADASFSGNLSNLQTVTMPPPFASHITRFDILPPRRDSTGATIGIATFGDAISVTIGSRVELPALERAFFGKAAELGLRVSVVANR